MTFFVTIGPTHSNVSPNMPKTIAVIAFEGISPFHLAIPFLVLGQERPAVGIPPSRIITCTPDGQPIRTAMGLALPQPEGLDALVDADVVIVPSWYQVDSPAPDFLCSA